MNIQEKLLPLIENTDYKIEEGELIPLPKIRQVEQVVHHEATEEAEAYDEIVTVDEEYFEVIPSMQEVKLSCIEDVVLAIEEYLADKAELRDPENDSISIVEGRIYSWGFTNIPQPSVDELYDAYLATIPKMEQATRKNELQVAGKKARQACLDCLDLIAGFNLERSLTATQISEMQNTFGQAQMALMTSRPSTAKMLISEIPADGILVTEKMKDLVLNELAEF